MRTTGVGEMDTEHSDDAPDGARSDGLAAIAAVILAAALIAFVVSQIV